MRVLDLFSGIGGFSLGLERAGMTTVAFCEIEPYCRAVLRKHWPEVPIYEDIRTLTADVLERDGIAVDAICGGFPCQDLSHAGKRAGLEGERSGLWGEYRRLIGELRPRFVIVENVPGLLSLGMGTVLGDLAALGYDAVWDCIPASAIGARHRRDRVWIIATDASGKGLHFGKLHPGIQGQAQRDDRREAAFVGGKTSKAEVLADTFGGRRPGPRQPIDASHSAPGREGKATEPLDGRIGDFWRTEPDVGRVANGVPNRAHRLKSLGNAVVPQIPELIGRAIMEAAQ